MLLQGADGGDDGRDGIVELPRVPLVGKAFESKLVLGRERAGGYLLLP